MTEFGKQELNVTAEMKSSHTARSYPQGELRMDTYVKDVESADPGTNSQDGDLIKDRLRKRAWIKNHLDVLLLHVAYHRNNKEEISLPAETLFQVGDEEGSHEIAK